MGYSSAWQVLENMIADLRKRGINVPDDVLANLKSAKTMINILKADPNRGETRQKIEEYLENVESHLISEGQRAFGDDYVKEWFKRLEEANRKVDEEEEMRFVAGLPREGKWIRIKPSAELTLEKLKKSAKGLNLSFEIQSDGHLLVHGADEHIKVFIRKIAANHGLKAEE